ncbi:MAG TPA: hypothetical protein VN699_06525, partial [Pirellulales bacterium]|nr:hypothetical protein [Pirellulales bacterium]
NLRRVCRGELFIETYISDRELNRTLGGASGLPIWRFYRHGELEGDPSNWFGPNAFAVVQAVESAGFDVQHADAWMLGRGAFRAAVKPGLPEFLAEPTIEGVFYDQIAAGLYGPKDGWRLGPSTQEMSPAPAATNYDSAYFGSAAWRWRQRALWSRVRGKVGRWLSAA